MSQGWETAATRVRETATPTEARVIMEEPLVSLATGGLRHGSLELGNY